MVSANKSKLGSKPQFGVWVYYGIFTKSPTVSKILTIFVKLASKASCATAILVRIQLEIVTENGKV
jgi:hypothetical protein